MFLKETKNNNYISPFDYLCFLNEMDNQYNNLCMKMVKSEHYAIMNESYEFFNEDLEDFKEKVKDICINIKDKFISFLKGIKNLWLKLFNWIKEKIFGKDLTEKAENFLNNKENYIHVPDNFKNVINNLNTFVNQLVNANSSNQGLNFEKMDAFISETNNHIKDSKPTKVTRDLFSIAYKFLKVDLSNFIKAIDGMIRNAENYLNKASSGNEEDQKKSKELLSLYTSKCNELIRTVNQYSTICVNVIKTWSKAFKVDSSSKKKNKKDKEDKSELKQAIDKNK